MSAAKKCWYSVEVYSPKYGWTAVSEFGKEVFDRQRAIHLVQSERKMRRKDWVRLVTYKRTTEESR